MRLDCLSDNPFAILQSGKDFNGIVALEADLNGTMLKDHAILWNGHLLSAATCAALPLAGSLAR